MILIKDKMANSCRTTVKNMNGGNKFSNYPLGLWSQHHFSITMVLTLHRSQGIQHSTHSEHTKKIWDHTVYECIQEVREHSMNSE